MFSVKSLLVAAVLGGATVVSGPALADVVYDQPGNGAACTNSCWTSTFSASQGGYRDYDDFSLSSAAGITGASWTGFIQAPQAGGPVAPTTTSWDIGIFADSAGAPGALLYSASVAAADVTATLIGVGVFDGPVNIYRFSAQLPGSFAALAGTTYWFSPLSVQPSFYPFFSWSAAASNVGTNFQQELGFGSGTFVRPGDRAFSLSAGVPEPATWGLMILGFGGMGAVLRRRREILAA